MIVRLTVLVPFLVVVGASSCARPNERPSPDQSHAHEQARLVLLSDPSGSATPESVLTVLRNLQSGLERQGYEVTRYSLQEVLPQNVSARASRFNYWDQEALDGAKEFGSRQGADGVAVIRVADARTLPEYAHGEPIRGCDGILKDPIAIKVMVIDLVDGITSDGSVPHETLLTDASNPVGLMVPRFSAFQRRRGESLR